MRWTRALITGASSGIGRSFAEELASRGTDVVLVARREDALTEVAAAVREQGGTAEVLVADLVDRDDLARVEARLADPGSPVDLLVNNAGYGTHGPFVAQTRDSQSGQVELNVVALTRLAHAAAAAMVPRRAGGIVNVGSVAGFVPLPGDAVYAASKAYVNSLSHALHEELAGSGVRVTGLAPGFTRTEFHARAEMESDVAGFPDLVWQDSATVVRTALGALDRNQGLVVPGLPNKGLALLSAVVPTALLRRAAGLATRLT